MSNAGTMSQYFPISTCGTFRIWDLQYTFGKPRMFVLPQWEMKYGIYPPINSRCCCKEMPPISRWNLHIFYPHYTKKTGKLFHRKTLSVLHPFIKWVSCIKRVHLKQVHKSMLCELYTTSTVTEYITGQNFLENNLLISWMKGGYK